MVRLGAVLGVLVLGLCACSGSDGSGSALSAPAVSPVTPTPTTAVPASPSATSASTATSTATSTAGPTPRATRSSTVATHLDVPWAVAFLPDGSALVTLRDQARLLQVRDGRAPVDLGRVSGVEPGGEGGLLGVAVSPTFTSDRTVFLYATSARDNRVLRVTFEDGRPSQPRAILTGIPKAGNHNGGRLKFGPDGFLYVTTGDAGQTDRAQDRTSLGGKILRITKEGKPAPGNPFAGSPVWSYGHRNVQGVAWAPDGTMYASEFGQNTWDELNRIEPGRNYGWPVVEGRQPHAGFVEPLVQWPTSDASPSGIAYADGAVWMAALRGESLWRIPVSGTTAGAPERLLQGRYGRLRDAVVAPDGRLWILTNNTSRGTPHPGDDKLLAIPLADLT
ncbi:PQQ-dependent sugar dehydrogenase [Pedococcus sp. KACC 23699]|uniref:PQQ-dependent sugar dehydrogenase n=1 Tax=Pedococcus sp. KACC 23699 TaxID=3149228 RepID=A0AAU7JR53_9MICO